MALQQLLHLISGTVSRITGGTRDFDFEHFEWQWCPCEDLGGKYDSVGHGRTECYPAENSLH